MQLRCKCVSCHRSTIMIQLSCCSSNIDYASHDHAITVLCMYACNTFDYKKNKYP